MRTVFEVAPGTVFDPKSRVCGTIGSTKAVRENRSGAMGLGSEYVAVVAPKCPHCGDELAKSARQPPRPPPSPPPEPSQHSIFDDLKKVPPFVWIIAGIVLLLWLGAR